MNLLHRSMHQVKQSNGSITGTTSSGSSPPPNLVIARVESGNGSAKRVSNAATALPLPATVSPSRCRFIKCNCKCAKRICSLCRRAERLTLKLSMLMYVRYLFTYVIGELFYCPLYLFGVTDSSVFVTTSFALFLNGLGDGLLYWRFYRRLRQAKTKGRSEARNNRLHN